jgi:hypothetical protein
MNEFLEQIKNHKYEHKDVKLNKKTSEVLTLEDKKESIEFLDFLVTFSSGYGKFMKQKNSMFHQALNIWIVKMKNMGFSWKNINGLCLKDSFKL